MNKPLYIIGDSKFSNPSRGIAAHPIDGLGHIRNVDIKTYPGIIRLNNLMSKQSASIVTGQILWKRVNPVNGVVYAVDDAGKVYTANNSGGSWSVIAGNTGGSGGGLEIWKDYLLVTGSSGLDAYGPLSGTPAWTNSFVSLDFTQSQQFSPLLKSIDDALYIGNGRYVSKLSESSTFNPSAGATYSFIARAISLAANYTVTSIRDLGSSLMVGTSYLNSSTLADIFPYSRVSLTLGIPIRIVENGIRAMYNYGNRLYVLAGNSGKLFISDTVSVSQVAQIPNHLINLEGGSLTMFPDSIMYLKGKIWFGVSNSTLGNAGIWSYNPVTKVLQMENTISTGNDGSTNAVFISSLQPLSINTYLASWKDSTSGTVYGVDLLVYTQRYTGYQGYVESPLIKVGEALDNATKPQLEINLIKPLITGQGIKIQYRLNLTSSFTDLVTADFASYGAYQSYNFSSSVITNAVFLQIRASLTAGASSNLSPELQSIMLK